MTRRVFITGVAGGIGAAAAAAFGSAGWSVAGVDVFDPRDGRPDDFLRLDVGDLNAERRLGEFLGSLGAIDAVVNAAGVQNTTTVLETDDVEWSRIMDVNLRGALWTSRAAYRLLEQSRGSVVNVSSVHAVATTPGAAVYAASKAALVSLTRSLALEWAPAVRVNCVLPGAVDTPMLAEGLTRTGQAEDEGRKLLEAGIPLQRVGRPAEVAEPILFLADGQRSSFVTGQTLVVDGGVLASLGTP